MDKQLTVQTKHPKPHILRQVGGGLKALIISLVVLMDVYPLFWMITASFKTSTEFATRPAYALNEGFYVQNYVDAWTRGKMSLYFVNSLMYTVCSLFFIVILCMCLSFALTKMHWKWRKFFSAYFALGIMIPGAVTLIPCFQIFKGLNLLNTRSGMIMLYTASSISFSIYLLASYMRSLPDEILEASVIDGCDIYKMLWHIVIPLMKNAIITVLVINFFFKWNDLITSMTFANKTSLKTVQTGLLYFQDEFGSKNWGAIFASVSISVMPMLLMYLFLNKAVIEGMTSGAVKG